MRPLRDRWPTLGMTLSLTTGTGFATSAGSTQIAAFHSLTALSPIFQGVFDVVLKGPFVLGLYPLRPEGAPLQMSGAALGL